MQRAENFLQHWYGRSFLLILGVGLLTAAFAPVNQFYLGWIGLVPWLLVVHAAKSRRSAFFWSWIAGTLFFIANMWWMAKVTVPGMIGLMAILGIYWGLAGTILRGAGLLNPTNPPTQPSTLSTISRFPIFDSPLLRCISIAATWISAAELLRGTWPWNGLPWLYLGYTQTPMLCVCQLADIFGVLGVSFLLALANAWIALWIINRCKFKGLIASGLSIAFVIAVAICYGLFRMARESLRPGPTVLVVQPNYPQDNSGNKGASPDDMLAFHVHSSEQALARHPEINLTVWSETIMPPFNPDARVGWNGWNIGMMIDQAHDEIHRLARDYHCAFLVGGRFETDFTTNDKGQPQPSDKRNSAYFFDAQGILSQLRYDKIHLVPFGEFIPFKQGLPPLYRLMIGLGPPDMASYFLKPGTENDLTVFQLARPESATPWRFVSPICFEDIDPGLCAKMFRPGPGEIEKRADFLVNLTNDGWFLANENDQHLQAAIFRSIENRVPSARSVNTGVSGFIDPLGRTSGLLPARTEGISIATLQLDSRLTFFTLHGQWFPWTCAAITLIIAIAALTLPRKPTPGQEGLAL